MKIYKLEDKDLPENLWLLRDIFTGVLNPSHGYERFRREGERLKKKFMASKAKKEQSTLGL